MAGKTTIPAIACGDLACSWFSESLIDHLRDARGDVAIGKGGNLGGFVISRSRNYLGQSLGEGLSLAKVLKHLPDLTELTQHRPQFDANLKGLLHRGLTLG
jgi:hypothetical protein